MAVNEPENLLPIPNGIDTPNSNPIGKAEKVHVNTTNLDGNLSGVDNDIQSQLEAIDNLDLGTTTVVEDVLTSESTINALSANQGNVLNSRVSTLENTAFNSGRSFTRFNDGFTIDRTNLATFEGKNIIYTAKNDKLITSGTAPDVNLPNDTEIQAAVPTETYPITFEFTHLGGTQRFEDESANVVRLFLDGVQIALLQRDEVAVVTKPSVGAGYEIQVGSFDPNDTLLPSGVFNLKTDTSITDITNLATELSGVTIVAGDTYLVETGGVWSGLTVPDNSFLVAVVDSASTVDSSTNNDWLVLDSPRIDAKSLAFLANFEQDGIAFNANRNININPSNVTIFNSIATGTPQSRRLATNTQGFGRQLRYDNVPVQFTDLVGGKLQLMFRIDTTSQNGFAVDPIDVVLHYSDSIQFTFPLNNFELDSGDVLLEIDIPTVDYTSILNTDVSLRLNYNFSGVSYDGQMVVSNVLNIAKGSLHDSILDIANQRADLVRAELSTRIDNVIGSVDDENRSLEAIQDRISPYKNVPITVPYIGALFSDSTGSDNFPTDLSTLSEVSSSNPRFTGGDIALFVAVEPNQGYTLQNITQDTVVNLVDSEATVNLGESVTFNGIVYFVFRVTGLTSGDVYEVVSVENNQVVAWSSDINNLEADVERIDAELEHALLNLPDAVVQVFEHEVTVTEENAPTEISSSYNNGLGDTAAQTVFRETAPNTGGSGIINSKPIIDTTGTDRYRNKLVYLPVSISYANQAYITAFDGTSSIDLVSYLDGTFSASVIIPSIPSGTSTNTIYPSPSTLVSGEGIWINVPALTTVNGQPVPDSDEIFFTRNVPATTVPVTIQYRGHADGNVFGTSSISLPSNQDSVTFTLTSGSETATVQVLRRNGQIRVSVTETVGSGLPTINDIEVILSYTETRTVPATPATTKLVPFEYVGSSGDNVFAIKADSSGNLILVGGITEINTGYAYTTLFGAGETGYLTVTDEGATFFDYEDFEPIPSTITSLENHSNLPQFGLFTTQYTHETIVNFDTQLRVKGAENDIINVGQELVLIAPNATKWRLSVDNTGSLITTQIV